MGSDSDFDERWNGASIGFEHWHFHRRLLQRYRMVLAPGEFSEIVRALRKRAAIPVKELSKGATVYRVKLKRFGSPIFVVAMGQQILSAYPPQVIGIRHGYLDLASGQSLRVSFRVLKSSR